MKTYSKKNVSILLTFVAVLMALSGCAALDSRPPEERVEERALAQATALLNEDYEEALQYVVPSYRSGDRARFYAAHYSGASFWTDVQVRWVRCDEVPEPDRCSVRIWIFNNPPIVAGRSNPRGQASDVPVSWETTWIKIDNQWYQYL